MASSRPLQAYSVGIICALATEKAAVEGMLDEEHPRLPRAEGDENDYSFGRIGVHDVVIACLPAGITGKASAAAVAKDMMRSFPIKVGLMVGIGGGVWSEKVDVRLGDVVVSQPGGQHGGVVQWDFGRMETGEHGGRFRRTGTLNKPPKVLLGVVQSLKAKHLRHGNDLERHLEEMFAKNPGMMEGFRHLGSVEDRLFEASYKHPCGDTCEHCDHRRLQRRAQRGDDRPRIHYGNIASGDEVMRDAATRDRIAQEEGVICFEMEAAGLMDTFPCVVIRGVCDYADSHKNKQWQSYAAAVAAAYAKEFLGAVDRQGVDALKPANSAKYSVPFSLKGIPMTDYYVERADEMQRLESFFQPTLPREGRSVFVVHGMGGIGKTQLCVRFARKHQERFSAIFWLDGSSRDALVQSMADAVLRVPHLKSVTTGTSVQELAETLQQWLSLPDNRDWLLVFDNVDRDWQPVPKDAQAYDYYSFLPSADHGNILVTTRLSRLQRLEASLQLKNVDDQLGAKIIEGRAGKALPGVEQLLEKLGGLPLALVQVGAYLGATPMTVSEYIRSYDETWTRLMRKQDRFPLQEYGERSVLTTWKLSYEQVERVYRPAAKLLDLWAFLHSDDVWYELLSGLSATAQQDSNAEDLPVDRLDFQDSIGILSRYSLVTATSEGPFSIHPVVHTWCLHNIEAEAERRRMYGLSLRLVAAKVESFKQSNSPWIARRLVAHAQAMGRLVDEGNNDGDVSEDCHTVGVFLHDWESSREVERLYKRALKGREEAWGPDHTSALDTVNSLGILYADQGKMHDAEAMYQRALKGYEKAWGPDHRSTLGTINNLGGLYMRQDKIREAEEMFQRALKEYEKALGPDHTSTLTTVNNLGILYWRQDKIQEAEEMFNRVLEGKETALRLDHKSTLEMVHNLGILYSKQGKMQEAEAMYQRALKGKEQVWGPDHLSTLNTVNLLGILYWNQGKMQEAEAMYQRAHDGREKAIGPDHTLTLDTINNLGFLYWKQGKWQEAEARYQRVLKGREKAWGPDHTSLLNIVNILGILYWNQGKMREAEEMYQRALKGREKACGLEHTSTLDTVHSLANLYKDQGKVQEAEEMYQRALKGYEKAWGPDHTSTLGNVRNQCELYLHWSSRLRRDENLVLSKYLPGHDPKGFSIEPLRKCLSLCEQYHLYDSALFGRLGRILLWYGKVSDAAISFQLQCNNVVCDGCSRQLDIEAGRLICKSCYDTDLCRRCYKMYELDELRLGSCQDHIFLAGDCAGQESLVPIDSAQRSRMVTEWFSKLKKALHLSNLGELQEISI